jgi:DNA-directed RNA polymerase subunit RPC12/RpoP
MVKVVSTNPHESVVKRIVCSHCGATLEYVPNDVKKQTYTDYSGCPSGYNYITCPNCSNGVMLKTW